MNYKKNNFFVNVNINNNITYADNMLFISRFEFIYKELKI